jgi:hypothetical protein
MSDGKDYEPGWAGLGILLWPIALYFRVRQWFSNRKQGKAAPPRCLTYYVCPHATQCNTAKRCIGTLGG